MAMPEVVVMRKGLANTFTKLSHGQKVVVAYFGGSITAGAGASDESHCYRRLLTSYLRQQFGEDKVQEVNAAIGGTGSWLGAFRLRKDVLEAKPDLVIVEYAVNDGGSPEKQVYASMEGIVRQVRKANPKTDLLFVYTLVKGHMPDFEAGRLPDRMRWHEAVAAHYGIPSVNLAAYAAAKILSGALSFDDFAKDGVHPTDRGYGLYLEALRPFVERCRLDTLTSSQTTAKPHPMPKPFGPGPMELARLVPPEQAAFDPSWQTGQRSPCGYFPSVVASDKPGATVTLRFRGDGVGLFDALGPDTGDLEVSIDGGAWQLLGNFDQYAKDYYRAHDRALVEGLDPKKAHELRLRVAPGIPKDSKGRFTRIGYFLVNGEVLR
jgi:lysophospholipase L1-like esterase